MFGIELIRIGEAGDFALAGLGGAMADVSVAAPIRWTITHVDGNLLMTPLSGQIDMVFTPSDSYALPNDTSGSWTGLAVIDLDGQLADAMVAGRATKVEVVPDNTLTASAANGGSAFIAKKDFNGLTITIPEPTSVSLWLCGLWGLWVVRRRA